MRKPLIFAILPPFISFFTFSHSKYEFFKKKSFISLTFGIKYLMVRFAIIFTFGEDFMNSTTQEVGKNEQSSFS